METLDILAIIGVICLIICYPVNRLLEKRNSRWSNAALAILIIVGLCFIGIWANL